MHLKLCNFLLMSFVYNSDQLVSCTLWEDYYLQFLEYLNESNGEGPIVILLTHARIKESQGIVFCTNIALLCCSNLI